MTTLRVLIAVTHLLGAGHLTRAAALARAFARKGHETILVSGGTPAPLADLGGAELVQLPPVRTLGTDFKTLLDENLQPVDEAYLDRRRSILLDTLRSTRPDILITELFPFGRRVLAGEFMALIEAAHALNPRPLVLCSIRDILVAPTKPERIAQAHEHILHDYDGILVHGDPNLVSLEASWPVNEKIRPLIRYTGYVDENENDISQGHRHGIVVSGGSSAASLPLYLAALEAAHLITDRPWRILIGRGVSEEDFQALRHNAPAHAIVERARTDFRTMLAGAEVSVSQAGYNTVVDLLRCGVRSVLIPFEAGHETEQRLRAERLKSLGLADIVSEDEASGTRLAEAIRHGLSQPASSPPAIALDGARQSVAIAESMILSRPALHPGIDWSPLDDALERAKDQGCPIRFWWRDDDAVAATPALDRLLTLSKRYGAGIGLAVIPDSLQASLASRLADESAAIALVHGWSHANHAPLEAKKAEFGAHRPVETMADEARRGLQVARGHLGAKLLSVFVPPWNRISNEFILHLPRLGFAGLSTFTDRKAASPASGLLQINTHLDPIDWHGKRSAVEPQQFIAGVTAAIMRRMASKADRNEPIGLLTHHLAHDEVIWTLSERLIAHLAERNITFLRPDVCFGMETGSHLRSNAV
ncbi:glycosyltransferase [Microvirga terrestris]|uniref:Glycosyl transferase family 28 n=1 Tax=Microvirga terrestris TaxID=2791024 RepID=A0ABS0HP99_9HYPH|nr:glycosyltransferase [Microvirga terrestris]MBF9195310.1 glycosyl transferase family 28 [Microvirga terrestris]